MTTDYTWLEINLAALFDRVSPAISNAALEDQWYWPRVQRLIRMADNGLRPTGWIEELFRELGIAAIRG